jgi:hypothetical protein
MAAGDVLFPAALFFPEQWKAHELPGLPVFIQNSLKFFKKDK